MAELVVRHSTCRGRAPRSQRLEPLAPEALRKEAIGLSRPVKRLATPSPSTRSAARSSKGACLDIPYMPQWSQLSPCRESFCTRDLGRTPDLNRQPLIHHSKRHKYPEETLKRHNCSKKRLIRALPASFVVAHLIGGWRRAPHHADIMLTHGTASLQLQPSRDAFLVVDMEARQDEHTLAG